MKEKFIRFMQGRYGIDTLSKWMMGFSLILIFLNMFLRINIINALVWVLLILVYFRMFSKNIYKRYEENQKFEKIISQEKIQKQIRMLKLRKDYHIYTCPTCRQKIKIPRGKGKIAIRCPKCNTEFIKRS